jgi:Leucine-rich repeat (LRR) protein
MCALRFALVWLLGLFSIGAPCFGGEPVEDLDDLDLEALVLQLLDERPYVEFAPGLYVQRDAHGEIVSANVQAGDEAARVACGIKTLRELDCGRSQISNEIMPLVAELPELRVLDVSRSKVTADGLAHVASLRLLEELTCVGLKDIGPALAPIARCENLWRLDLGQTNISSCDLEVIVNLRNLRALNLNHTPIDDTALQYIGRCLHLEKLSLEETHVTNGGVQQLTGLRSLKKEQKGTGPFFGGHYAVPLLRVEINGPVPFCSSTNSRIARCTRGRASCGMPGGAS